MATRIEASFPAGWKYRNKLTVDRTSVGSGNISGMPVLLKWDGTTANSNLPREMFDSDGTAFAKSNGSDIRITTDKYGVNHVPFEIVSFTTNNNPASASAEIWAKMDLDSTKNRGLYVWWGNTNAETIPDSHPYGKYNVWNSNYIAVYHLDGSGNGFNTVSTSYDATNFGTTSVAGKIGSGRALDGTTQNLYLNRVVADDFSIEFWMKPRGPTPTGTEWWQGYGLVDSEVDSDIVNDFGVTYLNNKIVFGVGNPDKTIQSNSTVNDGNWHFATATRIKTTSAFSLFKDGTGDYTATTNGNVNSLTDASLTRFGALQRLPNYFDGFLDEIRFSLSAKNSSWVATNYNTQSSPETFLKKGDLDILNVLTGWKRRCPLVINKTKVGVDETSVPIPFVWTGSNATSNLPEEMMVNGGQYAAQATGADIRFSSDYNGAEQLAFDISNFHIDTTSSSSYAEIWVNIKSLSTMSDTTVYVWYDNSDASAIGNYATEGRMTCWDGNPATIAVHHMNGSGDSTDAAMNGYKATATGTVQGAGKLGFARVFDDVASEYMQMDRVVQDDFSISFWVKTDQSSKAGSQWYQGNGLVDGSSTSNDFGITVLNNKVAFGVGNPDVTIQSTNNINDGVWHQVVATRTKSSGAITLFMDGSNTASNTSSTASLSGNTISFGRTVGSSLYLNGSLDEIQFISTALSSGQVTTRYNSQSDPKSFVVVGSPSSKVFPSGWAHRMPIIQNHLKNSGDQTNFPSLFTWTGDQSTSNVPQGMVTVGAYPSLSSGADIRFSSDVSGVNQFPLDVVNFSIDATASNARAEVHALIPSVSSLTDRTYYMWWGNPEAIGYRSYDIFGRNAVWPYFNAIYHMGDTGSYLIDSAGNNLDASSTSITSVTSGKIGKSGSFDGTNSFATIPTLSQYINFASGVTISGYMKPAELRNYSRLVDLALGQQSNNILVTNDGTALGFHIYTGGTSTRSDTTSYFSINTWVHVGATWDGTTMRVFKDGTEVGSPVAGSNLINNLDRTSNFIGKSNWLADPLLYGELDEIRIKSGAVSTSWVLSDANSLNSPQTYWSMGSIEFPGFWMALSGAWKQISTMYYHLDGTWKNVVDAKVTLSSTWKDKI